MSEEVIVDNKPKTARPKVPTESQKELDKVEAQFEQFNDNVKMLTENRMNCTPNTPSEHTNGMSNKEMQAAKEIYLKPTRTIGSKEKFNEKYRDDYNFAKEFVNFVAYNKEILGEALELWTKPFAGLAAEFWTVPVNKPVWGPRYLAEQIKRKYYSRLKMEEGSMTSSDGHGTYYGQLARDTIVQRLDAVPVTQRKSIFMGGNF